MLLEHGAGSELDRPREFQPIWACITTAFPRAIGSRITTSGFAAMGYEIVKALIGYNGNLNVVIDGLTCLQDSVCKAYRAHSTQIGADPSLVYRDGNAAVQLAEISGWHQVVDLMLRAAAGLEIDLGMGI
ncbi:hypothetical protein BDW68DRAFT_31711 [Aspergillus falconensis]